MLKHKIIALNFGADGDGRVLKCMMSTALATADSIHVQNKFLLYLTCIVLCLYLISDKGSFTFNLIK